MTWNWRAPMETVDPDALQQSSSVGIHVEISDIGACLSDCAPTLPTTGLHGEMVAVLLAVSAALLLTGILLIRRLRRMHRSPTT